MRTGGEALYDLACRGDMMKTIKWILNIVLAAGIVVLAVSLLTACSATPTVVALDSAAKDAVLVFSEPAADNLFSGLNSADYAVFSRDFDDAMLKGIDEKGFATLQAQVPPKIGKYLSRTVTSVEEIGDFYRLTYRASFEQDANVKVLLTFEKADPHKVAGLFFTSDKLK
jgi:hypothetical protein